ncbi:ANTAR domain-containing response regulator [Psychromonas sp. KJ10-10]|uniref:ANTAR domain-containing response regulator n=1 Tax=Psychromonas sp. KJ10-10 TaxID=3391823 RepID=UPI0039B55852
MKRINNKNVSKVMIKESASYSILLLEDVNFIDSHLKSSLLKNGHSIGHFTTNLNDLVEQVILHKTQVLIMSINQLGQKELSEIAKVNQLSPLPILILTQQVPSTVSDSSIKATIAQPFDDSRDLDELNNMILLAWENFKQWQISRIEHEETKAQLATRKLIDSARELIMQQKNLSKQSAELMLRKMSVDNRQTLVQAAENVISVCQLLKPKA